MGRIYQDGGGVAECWSDSSEADINVVSMKNSDGKPVTAREGGETGNGVRERRSDGSRSNCSDEARRAYEVSER